MKKAIYLDRDGVLIKTNIINKKPISITKMSEIRILDGVKESLKFFIEKEFIPIVVTNQPDVARGKISKEFVKDVNDFLKNTLKIEYFLTCFHDDIDDCVCRKPRPGMIFESAKLLNLDLKSSILVGDRWKDIEAGQVAGCECFLVDHQYDEKKPNQPYISVENLYEVAMMKGCKNGI